MRTFFIRLDEIAETERGNALAKWLDRAAFFFLVLMILSMPHSIAATHVAWILGMLAWIIRLFVSPRRRPRRTPLDVPLWTFFGWSALTALTSYAPDISVDKLRSVALFLIFYYVINVVKNVRAVKFLASALIFSSMVVVLWTPLERIIGRGVEIHGVTAQSPLAKAILMDGDALLRADGKKISSPDDLTTAIESRDATKVEVYRGDYYFTVDVKKADLLDGSTALERLGTTSWNKSHVWRSMGFYGHWTTFSEVLQLIASLVFGLLIAAAFGEKLKTSRARAVLPLLMFCFAAMVTALILNATRASQIALIVSMLTISCLVKRRAGLLLAAIVVPLALGGFYVLQQNRDVGDSDKYRETVYREGVALWTQSARNLTFGVGMDSIKRYAPQWHLFDDGRLPQGHFHSTPLQLLIERGTPALLIWLWILFAYARTLRRGIKNSRADDWMTRGILIGTAGGLAGFLTSGLVHYNLGDAEVAMLFFVLAAFGVFLSDKTENALNEAQTMVSDRANSK